MDGSFMKESSFSFISSSKDSYFVY
jgi:hypothetical protein